MNCSITQHGIAVDSEVHSDLLATIQSENPFSEITFKRLLWEQQLQAATVKDKRNVRWLPTIIKWCLSMKLSSSSAYRAMRDTGFITLPSTRTLRDYTHVFKAQTGIQPEVNDQIVKLDTLQEWQKYVCVMFDEVKIKEGLVFDKGIYWASQIWVVLMMSLIS